MAAAEVIVVGAGVAGCVVARRLAEAGRRVVVLEAGPGWPVPPALASLDATEALALADRFSADVSAATGGRTVPYRLGRGVGGSSAINAMVVTSGDRADYDGWARHRGCPGWDGAAMAPWLDRGIATVGVTGAEPGPLAQAWARAATAAGHAPGGASVALDARGVLTASLSARPSGRRSAADAYLLDGDGRPVPGVEVRAGAGVRRLTTGGGRVTGVELGDGTTLAAGLVVLCAGAVVTPLLLRVSGLTEPAAGPAPLRDHPSFVFTVTLRPGARQAPDRALPAISGLLRWWSGGFPPAPTASGPPPDLMALAMDHVGPGRPGRAYGALVVTLTGVVSTGHVAGDPAGPVTVVPGWLDHPDDRRRFRAGVRHAGTLLVSGALDRVAESIQLDDRGTPLAHLDALDDDELDRWLLDHPGPVRHPAATVPMGRPGWPGAAVDLAGALTGWDGVHLADASVLPHVPNANPMLPVLAVAERLASALVAA